MKVIIVFFALFLTTSLASAAQPGTGGTLVNLQVQSTREVTNDLMQAVMSSEREDKDTARAADAVNKTLREARAAAAKYPAVAIESGSYQSYPVYDKNGRSIVGWRVRAELRLKSRDFGQLTTLLGVLQSNMQFNGLEFTVAPETRRAAENELIGEAVAAFKQRAAIAQTALQTGGYTIKELNLNTQEEGIVRPMMKMASAAREDMQVAAPVAEPGTSRVSVQASGVIELH